MKYIFSISLFIAVFVASTRLSAQKLYILSAEDNLPIPSAHVVITEQGSKNSKLILSNTEGIISLDEFNKTNKIQLSISFIGFKKIVDSLDLSLLKKDRKYYLTPENVALNEVIITAQYAPNSPEKAVHKVKIIDSKKIESMGAQNLRDVLTNEMNVRISQDNILGSSMNLQGISGQNVKILVDGVPVTGRLNGNIDISQINMNNVERIEVIEGPLSVNYGTDALAGTINIITKKTQKETVNASINNYYESIGHYNFTGRIGLQKEKHNFSISGGRNFFDGWRATDEPFQIEKTNFADSTRFMDWKAKEQRFGSLHYSYFIKNIKVGYTGDLFHEIITNRGKPRKPYFETAFDDYYVTDRINNTINLSGNLSKSYYLNAIFAYNYYNRIKNTYYKDLTTLRETLTENPSDQDTTMFGVFMTRGSISTTKDSVKINYEIGYDINHETSRGIRIKNNIQQIGDYALFASAEYKPFSKFLIRPGIRYSYNTAYTSPIVPSINIRYQLLKTSAIRFSYARGFRAPSLKELYFDFVDINHNVIGNENLKAEYSNNFNFSFSNQYTLGKVIWKTENSYFYNYIDNMISLSQIQGMQYSYQNIDNYQTLGVQLQTEVAWEHLKVTVGGAYVGRYNELDKQTKKGEFTYSPEAKTNLFYELKRYQLTFGLFYKYTGELPMYMLDNKGEMKLSKIDDYHTADLSISKHLLKKKLNLTIGCKNIFNVTNVNGSVSGGAHSSSGNSISVGTGRSFFFKLDINLISNI
ncbi:MAG: TonB-dependent receptor [Flavobacteriales bacterium]|nr:TonB-dependent receptor [Flavobacteriales bacterium]